MEADMNPNSFAAKATWTCDGADYEIYRLAALPGAARLPYSLKVLLENLLRTEDGANVTADHINALASWDPSVEPAIDIQFTPARVLMQDFTGVPCIVDLAAMRDATTKLGADPEKISQMSRNPL
jgi:aconitate hydratase